MTNEQIENILYKIVKEKFPEIDTIINVHSEPDPLYFPVTNKEVYTVYFSLNPDDYIKYVAEANDMHTWNKIRDLIRDLFKMLGITDKVKFSFNYF